MVFTEREVQHLQNRVSELERQLAEAQDTIQALSFPEREELSGNDARQRAEELYAIIQTLHDPVMVYDQNGVIYLANASARRAHGFDPTGHHRRDTNQTLLAHYPDGRLAHSDELPSARALRGETVIDEALTIKNLHGEELSILVTSSPLLINGVQRGAVSVWHDITERKAVEEALQESEERFAKAFHASPDAIIISRLLDGLILEVNEGWSTIFGHTQSEVLGRTTLELGVYANFEDRKEIIDHLKETGSLHDLEIQMRRKSGELRQVSMSAEQIEINGVECLLAIIRDVTEQRQAEQALRESERRFRSLANSMPQLVWTARPDGTVDYYNQRYHEFWGIKRVAGAAWEWSPVLHPEDLQPTVDAWQHSVQTGEIYQIEHRVRMANDSYRWHLSRGVPMLDDKGRVTRWFGTATDIHDLKVAEEQLKVYAQRLERSNRELEQFAFIASHDLQEPLRKIEVFGDLLLESSKSLSGRERNYLDRMRDAAGRMRDMVDGLLQLSRVTTQGKPFIPVNLSQVISEVLHDLEAQIRRTDGKVEVDESLPAIEGDPLQVRQLMQNLIGNALKYHLPDVPPEVKVYAQQRSERIQVVVEDNGIGFHPEDAERVFQPFQRLVGRSQFEGSGMGLAICRRIAERHRGEISAASQPGGGATFIVTLPIYQPESTRKDVSHEASSSAPGRGG